MQSETVAISKRRRAMAIKLVVALFVAAVGVLVPLPRYVEEAAMATETRRPLAGQQPGESTTTVGSPSPTDPVDGTTSTTGEPDAEPEVTTTVVPPPTSAPAAPPEAPADDEERVAVAEDTRDFSLIGVTLDDEPTGPVLVRTGVDGGAWGPWEELEFDVAEELEPVTDAPLPEDPDGEKPGFHSDPLWVGDASRYQLELPDGDVVDETQVHLVYETVDRVAVAETAPAGADPGQPSMYPRSAWGARAPKVTPSVASSLKIAVVHHSAGTNNYSSGQVPAVLRGVQAYHMDANGWNDIGYNFAVDRFGRLWEARAGGITRAVIGGHARGFNTGSTGVVVLGNFETASPSSAVTTSVSRLLAWKFAVHDVDPRTMVAYTAGAGSPKYAPGTVLPMNRIVGHRDVGLTACPGRNLYAHMRGIRLNVNARYPALSTSGLALVGNFSGSAADDVFLRQPGVLPDQLYVGGGGRFTLQAHFSVRGTHYRPRVGDFDGNGYDDIFWYGPGSVADSLWLSRGNGTFVSVTTTVRGVYSPVVGDFNADGRDDVLWYAPGTAKDTVWLAIGGGRFRGVSTSNVVASLRPVAGDFDGDGDDDIFWHGPGSARDSIWAAQGGRFVGRSAPQTPGSYRPDTGDFNGDGYDDIMWYAPGSPGEALWLSGPNMKFRGAGVASVRGLYAYVRAGDYNADGRDELLWYSSPGSDAIWWHASSSAIFGRSLATVPQLR